MGVSSSRVPAARKALEILLLLSRIDVPVSAARIRSELDLPRSTTYHLLNELMDAGFVARVEANNTYGLGLAAYEMASAYSIQQPLARLANRPLHQLAEFFGGSGHLSRLSGTEIVYLLEVRPPGAVSLVTDVGVRLPALRTASGKAMLAHLPEVEARAVLATSGSGGSLREFQAELREIRARGWASEKQEVSAGQSSVAVPIVDHLQRPAAALAVTFSAAGEVPHGGIAKLQHTAAAISRKMYGHTGG